MSETLTLDQVAELARAALSGRGAAAGPAASVARSIVQAEADAMRPIGLGYLPTYCEHLGCGKVDGRVAPEVSRSAPSAVRVDARHGFAHPAIEAGSPLLTEAARETGVAAMAVTNSYACGIVGHHVEALARDGLVAFAFVNAPAAIAPWGGRRPLFGTNPLAFAAPRVGAAPLVIDQSSSVVAKVAIINAMNDGTAIPPHWGFDESGAPTTEADKVLKGGTMAPFGGHKGAGMALLVEIMAVAMTGATWSHTSSLLTDNAGGPPGIGQFFIGLDPARFADGFSDRLEVLLGAMTAQDGVRLPGDRRLAARQATARDGVSVDDVLLARLRGYAGIS
ncbi:MAG: Ldh family oxidoreductase [Alphaproteobacteria bacterium]